MEQRSADLPAGPIRYFETGRGPVLVLLHGGGLDSAELSWGHLIPRFAQHFRVLAPDWPGYGGSAWSPRYRTTDDLIRCLQELLDHWAVETACLAGISMGGGVALGFALSHPGRVSRMVLTGSFGLHSQAPMHKLGYLMVHLPGVIPLSWKLLRWSRALTRRAVAGIMRQPDALTDELLKACHAAIRKGNAGKAFHAWQRSEIRWKVLRTCYSDRLDALSVPTLLIHGAEDPLVPLAAVRQAAPRLPNGRLLVFEHTGHWPQRERPEEFAAELVEFTLGSGQA